MGVFSLHLLAIDQNQLLLVIKDIPRILLQFFLDCYAATDLFHSGCFLLSQVFYYRIYFDEINQRMVHAYRNYNAMVKPDSSLDIIDDCLKAFVKFENLNVLYRNNSFPAFCCCFVVIIFNSYTVIFIKFPLYLRIIITLFTLVVFNLGIVMLNH